ncbi:MAG: hypothetical protein IPI49_33260 [Myxococcales bacterium]|nr:hypothetical protein [Myxococcales bacterium]
MALAAARPVDAAPLYWLTAAHATLLGMTGELGLALRLPRMLAVLRQVIELSPTFRRMARPTSCWACCSLRPRWAAISTRAAASSRARGRSATAACQFIVDVLTARARGGARRPRASSPCSARVLSPSPAVFPEQRLAHKPAHRMARRYLRLGARWFAPLPR